MVKKEYHNLALEASVRAGGTIMEIYGTGFSVAKKEDSSPVTEADLIANKIICDILEQTPFPIISEENKRIDFSERKKWKTCWIVDPLDGTKEFVNRNGEFTVNIALVENGIPVLGIIYIPVSKLLYFTSENMENAYKIDLSKNKIEDYNTIRQFSERIFPKKDLKTHRVLASRSHLNDATKNYIEKLKEAHSVELVQKGSSLKFCALAEGIADIYPRFSPTMEWDTAAGHAICKAVGVEVYNFETKKPLFYNKENLMNPSFLAELI